MVLAYLPEHLFDPLGDQSSLRRIIQAGEEEEEEDVPWEEEGIALSHETDPALIDFIRSDCCYHYFLTWYVVTGHGPPRTPHPDLQILNASPSSELICRKKFAHVAHFASAYTKNSTDAAATLLPPLYLSRTIRVSHNRSLIHLGEGSNRKSPQNPRKL